MVILFLIGSIGGVFFSGYNFYKQIESKFWQKTNGNIVFSDFIVQQHSNTGTGSFSITLKSPLLYAPNVVYQYNLGENKYQNNRVTAGIGLLFHSKSYAEEMLNRYPVGKKVVVYYNPSNPNESVLEKDIVGFDVFMFLMSFIFVIIAISIIFSARKDLKKNKT